jgi:hypothetical protein
MKNLISLKSDGITCRFFSSLNDQVPSRLIESDGYPCQNVYSVYFRKVDVISGFLNLKIEESWREVRTHRFLDV